MTRRQEQELTNSICKEQFNAAIEELEAQGFAAFGNSERLRNCNAEVYETDSYYILKSYATFVACIEKSTNNCFDMLRIVYGYTNTSARQIAKFIEDYGCRYAQHFTAKDA